jgi:hypothetical protein
MKLIDLKGLQPRKKYENLSKPEKSTIDKYTSVSKCTTLKENSYSSSKLVLPPNTRKPSHNFLMVEGFSSINSELLSRRR